MIGPLLMTYNHKAVSKTTSMVSSIIRSTTDPDPDLDEYSYQNSSNTLSIGNMAFLESRLINVDLTNRNIEEQLDHVYDKTSSENQKLKNILLQIKSAK